MEFGITDAGGLSLEAGEGAGGSKQIRRDPESRKFSTKQRRQAPGRKLQGSAKYLQADRVKTEQGRILTDRSDSQIAENPESAQPRAVN